MKIHIIGDPGAGKTTLARTLADHLCCTHVELDVLRWEPNWKKISIDLFRGQVAQALRPHAWVAEGSYPAVCEMIWSRADMVVWLDYSLGVILPRLAWRSARYAMNHQELWRSGNHVTWRYLFGPKSIVLRTLRGHYRRRRTYAALWEQANFSTVQFVRLHSPYATRYWVSGFLYGASGLRTQPQAA